MFLTPVPGGNSSAFTDEATRPALQEIESTFPVPEQPSTTPQPSATPQLYTTPQPSNTPLTPIQPGANHYSRNMPNTSMCTVFDLCDLQAAAIRSKSCSRKNYATNLARELFSQEERSTCNVSGKCGKGALDAKRTAQIRRSCFEMFPFTNAENHYKAWQECVKAIDTAGRGLFRKTKENLH